MRRMIETAPRDGNFVILQEEATGKYKAARWSLEAAEWVGENGEPVEITPRYWYPIEGENHLQQGPDFRFFLRQAATQPATHSDGIDHLGDIDQLIGAGAMTVAEVGAQTTLVEAKRPSEVRWRLAASLIAASLVAVILAIYFRSDTSHVAERDQITARASELATVGREADDEVAQLRKVAEDKAAELQRERDRSAALASELAAVRRDFDTKLALSSKADDEAAQLRKVAEDKAAELQQERDHSAALASELTTVRRDFDAKLAPSSEVDDEAAQLRKVAEAKAVDAQHEDDHTASLHGPAPAAGASAAAPLVRKLDPDELATLMNRAKRLIEVGDISPARLLLERAAEAQEPTAALMLAQTYDPDVLGTQYARNIFPDLATARVWYQRAAQLGSTDAQRRLSQLQN